VKAAARGGARSIFLITSSPLEAYLMKKVDDAAQWLKMPF